MKTRCRILWTVLIVIAALLSHTVVMAATSETVSVEDVSVVSGGKSSFVIVSARNVSDSTASAVEAVQSAAKTATGVKLETQYDSKAAIATEILVGATSREESKILMNETPYGEYAIRVINGKIVIAAWDDKSIAKACDAFAAYVKEQGKKGELTVSGDYSASAVAVKGFGVIPHYGTVKTKVQLIDLADNSYMVYVNSTTISTFNAYLDSLEKKGFTEFSTREAGSKITFAVYKNEDTILHISFNASTREARIAADKAYDMTIFTEQAYEKVCEPTVTMVGQEFFVKDNSKNAPLSNGLCLVFRLEDGRFIIVDGGYHEASVNMLYKTLRKLHVNEGKITIAAWILTHPHSDHTGAFTMLSGTTIKKRIVVENFIHHIASPDQHRAIKDDGTSSATRTAMKGYTDANIIKAHSGQVIKAGGAEIEMLFTYADAEPLVLDEMNTRERPLWCWETPPAGLLTIYTKPTAIT